MELLGNPVNELKLTYGKMGISNVEGPPYCSVFIKFLNSNEVLHCHVVAGSSSLYLSSFGSVAITVTVLKGYLLRGHCNANCLVW